MMDKKYARSFVRAILAGMMISIGCCVFLGCYTTAKWVGAVLFAIGLMTVVGFKLDLYTGKVGYIVENPPSFLWYMPVIILGNFVGCLVTGLMMPYDVATTVVDGKLALDWYSVLFRGVFCGMLMFIAVDFDKQKQAQDQIAQVLRLYSEEHLEPAYIMKFESRHLDLLTDEAIWEVCDAYRRYLDLLVPSPAGITHRTTPRRHAPSWRRCAGSCARGR